MGWSTGHAILLEVPTLGIHYWNDKCHEYGKYWNILITCINMSEVELVAIFEKDYEKIFNFITLRHLNSCWQN